MMIFSFLLSFVLLFKLRFAAVCDESKLTTELKQDLDDNGVLDCLRKIPPPNGQLEDENTKNLSKYKQIAKGLAAQWDTDCSFEAEYDWMSAISETFKIDNLVDSHGDIVEKDFDDQADMCEIVRASVASGLFAKFTTDVTAIPTKIVDMIDCPGDPTQSEICAVTESSLFQNDTWYILLDGLAINSGGRPYFVKGTGEKLTMDEVEEIIPEQEKEIIRKAEAQLTPKALNAIKEKKLASGLQPEEAIQAETQLKETIEKEVTKKDWKGGDHELKSICDDQEEKDKDQTLLTYAAQTQISECIDLQTASDFTPIEETKTQVACGPDRVAFVFASLNGQTDEQNDDNKCTIALSIDGKKDDKSERKNGETHDFGLTTWTFAQAQGQIEAQLQYKSNLLLPQLCSETKDKTGSINIGHVLFNGAVYQEMKAEDPILFEAESTFVKSNAEIEVAVTETRQVLSTYAIVAGAVPENLAAFRLNINNKKIESSLSLSHHKEYVNVVGMAVQELPAAEHKIAIEYTSEKVFAVKAKGGDESVTLSSIVLPKSAMVKRVNLKTSMHAIPSHWSNLNNVKADFQTKKSMSLLVFYNINLEQGDATPFYSRVMISRDGVITEFHGLRSQTSEKTGLSSIFNVGARTLDVGKYKIWVEVMAKDATSSDWSLDPDDMYQGASLTIVLTGAQ